MADVKHTPGPWEAIAEKDEGNFAHSIYGEGYKGLLIARCNQNGSHDADARLIAAAPELLEALKALVEAEDQYVEDAGVKLSDPISEAVEAARATIAKATGTA